MLKFFFILLIFLSNTFSSELLISDKNNIYDAKEYITYIKDENKIFVAKDILKEKRLKKLISLNQFLIHKGTYWTKLKIKNNSSKRQELTIYNPFLAMDYIDVYIFKNEKQIEKHLLGEARNSIKEEKSRESKFDISLDKNDEITIISKLKNDYYYNLNWIIEDKIKHLYRSNIHFLLLGIIIGLLLFYSVNSFANYLLYKDSSFLLIFYFIFLSIIYIIIYEKMLILFNLNFSYFSIAVLRWVVFIATNIVLILFPLYIFKLKNNTYPRLVKYLKIKLCFFILLAIIAFYSLFINNYYYDILINLVSYSILNLISLFLIGLYMFTKKEKLALYYLFGHGSFLIFLFIYKINRTENIIDVKNNIIILITGLLLDILLFNFALFKTIKEEKRKNDYQKNFIIEETRFNSMGILLDTISHQFKHPLTHLGSILLYMQFAFKYKRKNFDAIFEDKIKEVNLNLNLLKSTIKGLNSSYFGTEQSIFNISSSIKKTKKLLNSKIILKNVKINISEEKSALIKNQEYVINNIFINLLNNSLEEFKSERKNNFINIYIEKYHSHIKIIYEDNAGGVKVKPIEKVFDYKFTTKDNKSNSGLGLNIVKLLIEDKLKGNISIKNKANGIMFIINLPTA